jgi:hypothetical protein
MNYGNSSISIIPLSEWESIKVSCDDDTYTIPSEKMLRELIIMPVPDLILITNILRQYGATERQEKEVRRIIDHTDYADKGWFLKIIEVRSRGMLPLHPSYPKPDMKLSLHPATQYVFHLSRRTPH